MRDPAAFPADPVPLAKARTTLDQITDPVLVRCLQALYSVKLPRERLTEFDLGRLAGQQDVVDLLYDIAARQYASMISAGRK